MIICFLSIWSIFTYLVSSHSNEVFLFEVRIRPSQSLHLVFSSMVAVQKSEPRQTREAGTVRPCDEHAGCGVLHASRLLTLAMKGGQAAERDLCCWLRQPVHGINLTVTDRTASQLTLMPRDADSKANEANIDYASAALVCRVDLQKPSIGTRHRSAMREQACTGTVCM